MSYGKGRCAITCGVIGARRCAAEDSRTSTKEVPMEHAFATAQPARGFMLKQLLVVDTLTCLGFGLLLLAAAAPLAALLGLPQALLFYAGIVLLPCAALMALAAKTLSKPLVAIVVAGNVAWVIMSVAVVLMFEVTMLGLAFSVGQAVVVLLLAVLEWRARGQIY
jgi:hypothetical protein